MNNNNNMIEELTTDFKRAYIYQSIISVKDTYNIIQFIYKNDIIYSQNMNGIHVNISILKDSIIDELYRIIFFLINDKFNEDQFTIDYNNAVSIVNTKNNQIKKPLPVVEYEPLKLNTLQTDMIKNLNK
jgi:hypothetical protein|tara:strand:- start:329 stop:715 length:387 start_codon:yes stop_codon:yes gene_type:complete